MGVLLGTMFLGLSFLAISIGVLPGRRRDGPLAARPHGLRRRAASWVVLQVATALILMLAANTVIRRLPAARLDPGARPLPAARCSSSAATGSRSRPASSRWRSWRSCCCRLRRQPRLADPALRGRRLHQLHAVAGGHGGPLAQDCASRAGSGRRSINGVGAVATAIVTLVIASTKFAARRLAGRLLIPLLIALLSGHPPPLPASGGRAPRRNAAAAEEVHVRAVVPIADLRRPGAAGAGVTRGRIAPDDSTWSPCT